MSATADIFLSYSRDDQAAARHFAEGFEREGFSVWWDVTLNAGEAFDQVTERALEHAKAVVVLWSKRSVDSRWVRAEATQALSANKLVPVMIEPCKRPIMFELTQTAELTHWQGDATDPAWRNLVSAVRRLLDGENRAAVAPKVLGRQATVQKPFPRMLLPLACALLIGGIVAGVAVTYLQAPPPAAPQPLVRFTYSMPDNIALRNTGRIVLAVAPDGSNFVVNTDKGLLMRSMGELEPRIIPGTEKAITNPFYSPDGRTLAFYAPDEQRLQRIAITGGTPVTITAVPSNIFGAHWARDDSIFYGQVDGIYRVAAAGGEAELVMPAQPGELLASPELLPDGATLLVSARATADPWDNGQVIAYSLATGIRTVILNSATDAHYLPTGHLIYAFGNTLRAVAFDPDTLGATGAAVALLEDVARARISASTNLGISASGNLIYLNGSTAATLTTPVWVTREGLETPIAIEPGFYSYPRLSPDGSRMVLNGSISAGLGTSDFSIWDFTSQTRSLLSANGSYAVWMPDGNRIIFGSSDFTIDVIPANNAAPAVHLSEFSYIGNEEPSPYFLSASGIELVYRSQANPATNDDIAMITVGGQTEAVMLLSGPGRERNAELSPDGRWMAYESDESGTAEVYVRPFPNVADDRVQVSNSGGSKPLWSPDGTELFYLQGDTGTSPGTLLMSASIVPSTSAFAFSARTTVMQWPYVNTNEGRDFDIAPDGQRFVALKFAEDSGLVSPRFVIVQNWIEELKRLVPVEPR